MNIDLLIPEPERQPSASLQSSPAPEPTPLAVPTTPPEPSPTEDAVWDAGSDEAHPVLYKRIRNNAGGSAYISATKEDLEKLGPTESLIMPAMERNLLNKKLSEFDFGSVDNGNREDVRHLGLAVSNVMPPDERSPEEISVYHADDILNSTVTDPASKWMDKVPSSAGNLGIAFPMVPSGGERLSGRRAVLHVQNTIGRKPYTVVPLWHSGIWFRIRRPVDGDILDLMEEVSAAEIQFGRNTYGHSFSNDLGYTFDIITDFFLDHVEECSLAVEHDKLKEHILTPDISAIAWVLASAIYPRGFRYSQSCMADHKKCRHVIEGLLDLAGMYKADVTRLTAGQITHMTNRRTKTMTPESVKSYQESFILRKSSVTTESGSTISFKLPSIADTVATTTRWMESITNAYPAIMEKPISSRNRLLRNHARASSLRRYSQYVKEIDVQGSLIDSVADIEASLAEFSGDGPDRKLILAAFKSFIAANTISVVAAETPICPSCKSEQVPADASDEWPDLIVIDPVRVFFLLMPQRVQLISQR